MGASRMAGGDERRDPGMELVRNLIGDMEELAERIDRNASKLDAAAEKWESLARIEEKAETNGREIERLRDARGSQPQVVDTKGSGDSLSIPKTWIGTAIAGMVGLVYLAIEVVKALADVLRRALS